MQTIPTRPSRVLQIAAALYSLVAFANPARANIFQWEHIDPAHPSQGKRPHSVRKSAMWKLTLLTTMAALLVSGQSLAAEIALKLGPGGSASLVNSSLDTSIILTSYSITRGERGVELLPAGWDSFQLQGDLFSETSATVDLLSEAAVADGLLFGPGQSRSIGVPFNLRADADGNGTIDLTDFAIWKSHQGQPLEGPGVGDFDSNGVVDLDDFELLLNGMGNSAVYTFAATTAVPETSALVLLSIGLPVLFPVRRVALRRPARVLQIAAAIFVLAAFARSARADIFQWEYINPANPSQGKQQSTTLAPGGAGVDAAPGADFSYRNLTMAYLTGADLMNSNAHGSNLTNADLSQANLTNSDFLFATLTRADFTDAHVRGARFDATEPCGPFACPLPGTGLTLAQLYSTASYQAHNLDGIGLAYNYLAGGNFAGQDFTNANFHAATLTDADFTSAVVSGASFYAGGTGLTMAQLDSTASYQAQNLTDIGLDGNLSGWNLAGQNLTNANFHAAILTGANFRDANLANAKFSGYYSCDECFPPTFQVSATLTDADFTGAEVRGADFHDATSKGFTAAQLYSTASYQAHDLTGIDLSSNGLSGWNFAGQNLSNANFEGATLTNGQFTGAEVSGANFAKEYAIRYFPPNIPIPVALGTGISPAQLYSTAGYQAGDLSGINVGHNDLAGANFAGQNLTNANFWGASLTDADFTAAEVRGASFGRDEICVFFSCQLTSGLTLEQLYSTASYEEHDIRGVSGLDLSNAITTNLILPNGHIDGLDLDGGGLLVLRDYDGDYYGFPSPILVDQHLTMGPGGTLRMLLEADAWDSTISFAPGIPVKLGGTLELTFADDVNISGQVGRTFDLFDWIGVTRTGAFAVSSRYTWDTSKLYTTGEITLSAVPEPSTRLLLSGALAAFVLLRRSKRVLQVAATSLALVAFVGVSQADIYQWEYINPANPNQGKKQSTTLAPGGAGVDASPGTDLSDRDLQMAYLNGADLTGAYVYSANLTNADLSQANLTNASFVQAELTGADLSDANLTHANLGGATLTGASFRQAKLVNATFAFCAGDAECTQLFATLTDADFTDAELNNVSFYGATLTDVDFTGADVRGASFSKHAVQLFPGLPVFFGTGITPAQLNATASYQAHELSGVDFTGNDLAGANFAGQNLVNAHFLGANLTGANFREANITNAGFYFPLCFCGSSLGDPQFATLADADFTAADARGAYLAVPASASTTNLIRPDGHIYGLDLDADGLLAVRDYDGGTLYDPNAPPIPITVDQHLTIGPGGVLRMIFEVDAWDSTISFANGIPVTLGGTLELTFAADVNLASQVGRTFDLFDWTGVAPTGAFAVSSPYAWDLSRLHTTGEVSLTAVPEPATLVLLIFAAAGWCIPRGRAAWKFPTSR